MYIETFFIFFSFLEGGAAIIGSLGAHAVIPICVMNHNDHNAWLIIIVACVYNKNKAYKKMFHNCSFLNNLLLCGPNMTPVLQI